MADPMKIRARLEGDVADVRVLMAHPMETGQRKGPDGKLVPLHFIQTITAQLNGKPVFQAEVSQAISRNPVFGFKVKGDKRTDEVTLAAG
jgi:sulfur-oxidizing protein SoxZ